MPKDKSKSKSPLAIIRQAERINARIEERLKAVEDKPHVPGPDFNRSLGARCDQTCPVCHEWLRWTPVKIRLKKRYEGALVENAQSRLRSVRVSKITRANYEAMAAQAANKKDLARKLDVTPQALRDWEKDNL